MFSEEHSDWLEFNINLHVNHYFQADRNGPHFQAIFDNTEQMVQVSACRFYCLFSFGLLA